MTTLSQQESRKRYSWWWDSHISPKNSKWLQENLTGMDGKVKQMIKLIEEDADSFARRAEMYYKRRPELMRLVEEFYRAYRALAERYDHATGVIRHAHKTMVEAFPDQDPSLMSDDVDANSPFMPSSVREFFDPDELQKDALGLSSPDMQVPKRKGLKQIDFFEKGTARKSLNFNEARGRILNNGSSNNVGFTDSKHKHDADISVLEEALAKLEAEKEAGILNYQSSLERLSNLDKEIRLAQEDSEKLAERAIKAEAEVELLNGALIELKAERELVLLQYQQCLTKISLLEEQISRYELDAKETSGRAKRAESEVQLLKQDFAALQAEKEAIATQHKQCMETITDVETKLQQAGESVRIANERAKVAENKVENLNLDIIELTEEKKAFSVQCQQYLERISSLEFQILFSQEEAQRLNEEINNGVVKLKDAEEQSLSIATAHQSLQSDLESLIRKMESKNRELTEKQMELNTLWTCIQEERSRFVEAETAFQTLQHLHNESQEELTTLASELQNRAQTVLDLEGHNHCLREEVLNIKEENRILNETNLSSVISMENMQDEISSLRATIVKLNEEIQIRVNERNVLQQEIYCLREEFNELKLKHGALLEQMKSLELEPDSFGSTVTELRVNSSKLNDAYQIEKSEKVALLEKLKIMARLVEKNAVLEISIADLNAELQQVKDKMKMLGETCHLLVEERSTIVAEKNALHSQIQVLTEKSGALTKKNVSLENSLADANTELEVLKETSRRLEDSLLSIGIEKTGLLNLNETLSSQLKVTRHRLQDTEIKCEELEVKNFDLDIEKQLLLCNIGELRDSLNSAKQHNSDTEKLYQTLLASLECQLHLSQEEAQLIKNLYSDELDTTVRADIEISILHNCLQDLHGNNRSLGRKCLEFFEASQASEKLISDMERKYADQQSESKALFGVLEKLRAGLYQMSKTLDVDKGIASECIYEDLPFSNQHHSNQILETAENIKIALTTTLEDKQQLLLEKSVLITLLRQQQIEAVDLDVEKCILSQNLKASALRLLELSTEVHVHKETNARLERKCIELIEASRTSEKLISDLEQRNADQQAESKALSDVLEKLRAGFYQMWETLDVDKGIASECFYEDLPFSNWHHLNQILETAEDIKSALTTTLEDKQQLLLEKSVLITLLRQLQLEAVDFDAEKCILSQNLKASAQRLLELSTEVHLLKETNAGLRKTVEKGDYREKMLRKDINELSLNLLDVQGSYQNLQQAHNSVVEEKKSLMKELSNVKIANCALEEEIYDVLGDALSLNSIFLVFQDFFLDKSTEVKKLDGSIRELHHIKDTLEEIIQKLEVKLQIVLEDKSCLMELLEDSKVELKNQRSFNNQLSDEVSNGKELLHQKEMDLSEAKLKLETLLNEQTKLQSTIEDLKVESDNKKAKKEEKTEQIFELVKENGRITAENDDLQGSKDSLETELSELIKTLENVKTRELLYEKEYEELFRDQQISAILEACYHEKFQELCKKFESAASETSSMDLEARVLKERIMVLEVKIARLKAHFKENDSAVKSLSNSVASLESQSIFHEKLPKINVTKDTEIKQETAQEDTSSAILATGCSELKNLQRRIQAVELAVDDIQKLASGGSLGSSVRAQASLVHTDELESGRSFRRERSRRLRRHNSNASSEITELPKDIMLDQVSDCSSYGLSKREIIGADNQMLESWGTAYNDSSMNFSDAKAQKPGHGKKISASEITSEKEMTVVDKLEITESPNDPQQIGKKVKILERLHFDAQKLANLQKTVQDLKSKVGNAEKSKKTRGVIEYDTVKEQLEEAEEAIDKLFEVNKKLTRTVEGDSLSSKSENGSDESATVRRRRVLEQIRRASEKISRLHFEVQKLQFLLLKLEAEKEATVKTRVIPRSPRVRLQDYLYGGSRQVFAHKQKREHFCGCIRPSTKGD